MIQGERKIKVEVAYAEPAKQVIVPLMVDEGCTAYEAVRLAGLEKRFPELSVEFIESAVLGVFGKVEKKPKERVLQPGERVEVYRPLQVDPKEVRKRRAAKAAEDRRARSADSDESKK